MPAPSDPRSQEQRTLSVWQSRTKRALGAEDAREITANMVGFFALLREWQAREDATAAAPVALRDSGSGT